MKGIYKNFYLNIYDTISIEKNKMSKKWKIEKITLM